jgi:hypothetical protein
LALYRGRIDGQQLKTRESVMMSRLRGRRILIASSVAMLAGCEHAHGNLMTTPDMRPLRIEVPDRDFRIGADDRARIVPDVDPDAQERLLGMVRPDVRAEMLRMFQYPAPGERFAYLFKFTEPQLQAVLEEVWAPAWADASDELLESGGLPHPGREIALRRREERRHRDAPAGTGSGDGPIVSSE